MSEFATAPTSSPPHITSLQEKASELINEGVDGCDLEAPSSIFPNKLTTFSRLRKRLSRCRKADWGWLGRSRQKKTSSKLPEQSLFNDQDRRTGSSSNLPSRTSDFAEGVLQGSQSNGHDAIMTSVNDFAAESAPPNAAPGQSNHNAAVDSSGLHAPYSHNLSQSHLQGLFEDQSSSSAPNSVYLTPRSGTPASTAREMARSSGRAAALEPFHVQQPGPQLSMADRLVQIEAFNSHKAVDTQSRLSRRLPNQSPFIIDMQMIPRGDKSLSQVRWRRGKIDTGSPVSLTYNSTLRKLGHTQEPYMHHDEDLRGLGGQKVKVIGIEPLFWIAASDKAERPKIYGTNFLVIDGDQPEFDFLLGEDWILQASLVLQEEGAGFQSRQVFWVGRQPSPPSHLDPKVRTVLSRIMPRQPLLMNQALEEVEIEEDLTEE